MVPNLFQNYSKILWNRSSLAIGWRRPITLRLGVITTVIQATLKKTHKYWADDIHSIRMQCYTFCSTDDAQLIFYSNIPLLQQIIKNLQNNLF